MADLVTQTFEGAGIPGGWTATGAATKDYDNVTNPLGGAQDFKITLSGNQGGLFTDFTDGNERFAYFMFRTSALTGMDISGLRPNGSSSLRCRILLGGTGTLQVFHGATNATTVGTLSINTAYHIWFHYNQSAGTASVGFSTDGTRPTSGNSYASLAGGAGTTAVGRFVLGTDQANETAVVQFDNVIVADTQIGNQGGGGASAFPHHYYAQQRAA